MAVAAKDTKNGLEADHPYGVKKDLFEASTKIKNQLELIDKRLQKMDDHRDQVTDSVYLKVKTDYELQREEVTGDFQAKCQEIETELAKLYLAREEQQQELAKHEEVLEEAKFRHTLGEYTDKKYKETEGKQNKEIKSFKSLLDIIKGSIEQYEGILGHPFNPDNATAPAPAPAQEEVAPEEILEALEDISIGEASATDVGIEPVEHTPATGVPLEGVPDESLTDAKMPPPEPETSESTEEQIDDELDSFLQTEGDYFGGGDESTGPAEEAAPEKPAENVSPAKEPPSVSTTQPDDDSISNILKDIPMEEAPPEGKSKPIDEETGARIEMGDSMPEASLLLLEGELDDPEIILAENISIGRSPSNDLILKESKVSRQHATINFREGHFVIVDLKSANGILVNEERVEEAALKDGDELRVGSFKFQFNIL